MVAHKRTEITVETHSVLTIRRRRSIRAWCPECGGEVEMVGLQEAEALTGMSGQAFRDSAKAPGWHFSDGQDGTGLVCLESLLKSK
ncbi:MAG TPA: hypothetical protein VJX30_08830 [Terriglobales bacterium]|nr:hypothetical protein [Terriglobales bacterium]